MDPVISHHSNSSSHHNGGEGHQNSRASSSSTPPGQHYVFLSFREETHSKFPDLLYNELINAQIPVFRGKKGPPMGEMSENELLEAIETSKISIPIICPDYASSECCLKVLVQILKCKKSYGQLVLPIFYRVKPSDFQNQLDVVEMESQEWKDALMEVSCLKELKPEKIVDGYDEEHVNIVVAKVLEELKKLTLVSDHSIGFIDKGMKNMTMVNEERSNDGPSNSSQLTSSLKGTKYDVFLSFRGEDTRHSFTSFLYQELRDAGVDAYMDSEEILASADIHPSLMEAIENSTIAVPIFSKDYASSKSCLRELEKIYECIKIIVPIFYFIEPSDVGNQRGSFKKSFEEHQNKGVCSQELNYWKKALKKIADLKGYTIEKKHNQAKLVREIVSHIGGLLKPGETHVTEYLVGMDPHVQEIVEKLQVSSRDVRVFGIYGRSGIGKTTLARLLYNKLRPRYKLSAFISNIEGSSKVPYTLQRQLISELLKGKQVGRSVEENKTFIRNKFNKSEVLIVLDNVECSEHVEAFAGDLHCFGAGSRIIVTAKTATVFDEIKIKEDLRLQMHPLNKSDSLKLFCWHAFGREFPMGGYNEWPSTIASNTEGIPSVIKAVGCHLSVNRDEETWKETSQQLENADNKKMDILLSKCYEKDLDKFQQHIFLDIACFLEGKSKSTAHYMWAASHVYPITGVQKLLQLSLLKIGENDELLMANPVRNFGKKLVIAENSKEPSLRSRLWSQDDALEVLKGKKGSKNIQAFCLNFDSSLTESLTNEAFQDLLELRFLRLDKVKITGDFSHLFPKLMWLDLKDCCDILEELKDWSLKKLLILDISETNIKQDWQGWGLIMKKAEDLKVLVLASCQELRGSPTFPDGIGLERLSFEDCQKLRRINTVSNALESLVSLNLKGCKDLNVLPKGPLKKLKELVIDGTSVTEINAGILGMKELTSLSAVGCKNLARIDDSIENLRSLSCLMLDETAIESLPKSIGSLTNLQNLSLRECRKLHSIPESIGKLHSLTRMDLSDTAINELPPSVEHLKLLTVLLLRNTNIEEFPEPITKLERLKKIDFSSCRQMRGRIPDGITNLSFLTTLLLSKTAISVLPDNISGLCRLQVLNLWKCKNLKDLPCLPASLTTLHVGSSKLQRILGLSHVKELVELHLADNTGPVQNDRISEPWPADSFQWIPHLPKLETLELQISKTTKLPNLSVLHKLRKLVLSCPQLQSLPKLPPDLTNLHLKCCRSITQYENMSVLSLLSELEVDQCGGGSINLENLRELRLLTILCDDQKIKLCGIEELHHLRKLTALNCLIQGDLSELRERGTSVDVI